MNDSQPNVDEFDLAVAVEHVAEFRRKANYAQPVLTTEFVYSLADAVFTGQPFTHQGKTYAYVGKEKREGKHYLRFGVVA